MKKGNDVELRNITMRFGGFTAVKDINLRIGEGEFFSILGPSGCGKTTILRMIAGFLEPTEGGIYIANQDMSSISPNDRPTAMIFQNLALFPHMKVWENVAFGLEARGIPPAKRRKRAAELLELIAMPDTAEKKVDELSGGQRQRVAVARALAVEPAVMLLDEPLSALDLKLRQYMRSEFRAMQKKTGITFIYITHDQGEALTMSDRIAVMSQGVIEQIGDASAIYSNPETPFVASFVGENNPFAGRIAQTTNGRYSTINTVHGKLEGKSTNYLQEGDEAVLFVRPEHLNITNGKVQNGNNRISSEVNYESFEGSHVSIFLRRKTSTSEIPETKDILVRKTNNGNVPALKSGEVVNVEFSPEHAVIMPGYMLAHG